MFKLYQRKIFISFWAFAFCAWIFFPITFAKPLPPSGSPSGEPEIPELPLRDGGSISRAVGTLYKLGLPVAILIGLFLIALNGYGLMTSDGEPRKVQEAKEGLFSAIMGLVFVIIGMVIYRVIVDSLIPGGFDSSFSVF